VVEAKNLTNRPQNKRSGLSLSIGCSRRAFAEVVLLGCPVPPLHTEIKAYVCCSVSQYCVAVVLQKLFSSAVLCTRCTRRSRCVCVAVCRSSVMQLCCRSCSLQLPCAPVAHRDQGVYVSQCGSIALQLCCRSCSLRQSCTGRRRPIGCLKLQVIFCKRATNDRALLRKMTYEDKASYGSSPSCTPVAHGDKDIYMLQCVAVACCGCVAEVVLLGCPVPPLHTKIQAYMCCSVV